MRLGSLESTRDSSVEDERPWSACCSAILGARRSERATPARFDRNEDQLTGLYRGDVLLCVVHRRVGAGEQGRGSGLARARLEGFGASCRPVKRARESRDTHGL